jgi:quercetin dioxygenase-like cupin family protein
MALDAHPFKVSLADFPVDGSLRSEDGWKAMNVQWLITSDSVGAQHHVLGYTVFQPGGEHERHRHPNAEEAEYLIAGSGISLVGDEEIEHRAGEVVFVPRNEWHGFRCTSNEPAIMLWTYGGVSSLDAAGYVREEDEAG